MELDLKLSDLQDSTSSRFCNSSCFAPLHQMVAWQPFPLKTLPARLIVIEYRALANLYM